MENKLFRAQDGAQWNACPACMKPQVEFSTQQKQ